MQPLPSSEGFIKKINKENPTSNKPNLPNKARELRVGLLEREGITEQRCDFARGSPAALLLIASIPEKDSSPVCQTKKGKKKRVMFSYQHHCHLIVCWELCSTWRWRRSLGHLLMGYEPTNEEKP